MKLKSYAYIYTAVLATYVIFDAIWLGVVARDEYRTAIGFLMRKDIPLWPWISFYLLYSLLILKLCLFVGTTPKMLRTLIHGVSLGMASYGAYNLTNYAIIEGWPLSIVMTDWMWGIFVTASSALAGFFTYVWARRKERDLQKIVTQNHRGDTTN